MTNTEYTDFTKATQALHTAMPEGINDVTMKTYQRPSDLLWVWAVLVTPSRTA